MNCDRCNSCEFDKYSKGFKDCPNPFDNLSKTDTSLSTSYSTASLLYRGENHTDEIKGSQLGQIINLEEMRNFKKEDDAQSMCSELIYRKYGDCGEGCKSLDDSWQKFGINTSGAKVDGFRFVRGANTYGCPQYLTTPPNTDQWYFAGWRRDITGGQFGYFQPEHSSTISGNTLWVNDKGKLYQSPAPQLFPMVDKSKMIFNQTTDGTVNPNRKVEFTEQLVYIHIYAAAGSSISTSSSFTITVHSGGVGITQTPIWSWSPRSSGEGIAQLFGPFKCDAVSFYSGDAGSFLNAKIYGVKWV